MSNPDHPVIDLVDFTTHIVFEAYQHDLDMRDVRQPLAGLEDVYLDSDEALLFGNLARLVWRQEFATLLQVYGGEAPRRSISMFVPLVLFREVLCRPAPADDERLRDLAGRMRSATRGWRDAGADLVHIRAWAK